MLGPQTTLPLGAADELEARGLNIFWSRKDVRSLESSKDFGKHIMNKYNVPTGAYETFTDFENAKAYVLKHGAPIVIKEDGLKAGKGVTVAMKIEEAVEALKIAFAIPDNKVVIEEYLDGFEFSLIALAHEDKVIPLEVGQDHKRVFDGDKGPNTGGVLKHGAPIVIKEDGLKAGKGVTVAMKIEEAVEALKIAFAIPDNKVVIEEYLDGFEFSLIALAHEDKVIPLEVGQDHKRVFDGDKGPNTGGMGVYSPVRRVTKEIIDASVNEISYSR